MPSRLRLVALVLPLALVLALPAAPTADAGDLAAEHRTGTVLAVQGSALVKPGGRRRWTPLGKDAVLLPGDLLKTQTRGAHALEVQLAKDGALLMGPGAQVLLPEAGRLQVLAGEVEIRGTQDAAVKVTGPGGFGLDVTGTLYLRAQGTETTRLEKPPRWLEGYRASTGEEWMGSLLANVDGRNVPLAVGYHKVTVDVRDQIARTTVEQSFVNSTDGRLEGVFYFPLPADASISGFGMWIGGELVEADVVEKARARQIYEDILRRKKDPGLLEWSGGNLFKARVFPIEPHSEKRVRVRYTQVLRLEGNTFRYRYALRSDLLRSKPLRRLDVQVNVLSTRPVTDVACPSHATRITNTGHEARIELSAEEYVPKRDLEVAITLQPTAGLDAITHRRGDEGWFMLLLTPPEPEAGGWTRSLMPEGDPLDVVIVADTSGSMDHAARETQREFVAALLALLGDDDRFRLAVSDVDTVWAFPDRVPATEDASSRALALLDGRPSLGWTDLDRTFEDALGKAGEGALVVYVGDGIPTSGDADPAAQAARLRLLGASTKATVHAVSPSSTYEQPVLEALASIGGGSVRRADADPAGAAYALLSEAARPVLKDLKVRVAGVPTARVYPETLPNLPLGSQQVVLGRFLPKGHAQRGTVVVEGTLGEKPVRYETALAVPGIAADDVGNSFLPRLWARKHLDVLLRQGASAAVQQEIVGFSAEYGILTPYTSLLVLESDEDRERYGVTRTVKMRDGEAFFAEGRDKVQLEMQRTQARAARAWRLNLRRRMIREIAGLGRDLVPETSLQKIAEMAYGSIGTVDQSGFGVPTAGVPVTQLRGDLEHLEKKGKGAWGGELARDGGLSRGAPSTPAPVLDRESSLADPAAPMEEMELGEDMDFDDEAPPGLREPSDPTPPAAPPALRPPARRARQESANKLFGGRGGSRYAAVDHRAQRGYVDMDELIAEKRAARRGPVRFTVGGVGFPRAVALHEPEPELPTPAGWSPEALEVLRSLDRRAAVTALPGGVEIVENETWIHRVRGEARYAKGDRVLAGSKGWYLRRDPGFDQHRETWADGKVRVDLRAYTHLGRRRPYVARDAEDVPGEAAGLAFDRFLRSYRRHRITLEEHPGNLVRVVIHGATLGADDLHLLVDPSRGTLVERRRVRDGRTLHRARHTGFVQAAGLWWPRLSEYFDGEGRKGAFTTRQVRALDAEAFTAAFAKATTPPEDAIVLDGDLPEYDDVVQAISEGRGTFTDHLLVALHRARKGQWDEALAALDAAQALVGEARGASWIRLRFLTVARRAPEALALVRRLATTWEYRTPDETAWAGFHLWSRVRDVLGANEALELLEELKADWVASEEPLRRHRWFVALENVLRSAGRNAEARQVLARMVAAFPYDVDDRRRYADDLVRIGDGAGAIATLEEALAETPEPVYTWEEKSQLYASLTDHLWRVRDLERLETACAAWVAAAPRSQAAWYRLDSVRFLRGGAAQVDADVLARLREAVPADPRSPEHVRLAAALDLALGGGAYFNQRRIEEPFLPALIDLGLRIAREDAPPRHLLDTIRQNYTFRNHDAGRLLREGLRADVLADGAIASMDVRRLVLYGTALPWSQGAVEDAVFETAWTAYRARFDALEPGRERDALGRTLLAMRDARKHSAEAVAFLSAWVDEATGFRKAELAAQLFDRLLKLDHSGAREAGAFELLPLVLHPDGPDTWTRTAASAVRRIAAWSYAGRRKAAYGPPEETAELTRAEAKERWKEAAKTARKGLVTRLAEARDAADDVYRPWLEIERLGYAVELGEDLPAVAAAARELLDQIPVATKKPLARALAERAVLVLCYGATRRDAPEGAAGAVLTLLSEREADAQDERLDWRYQTFRLLVALDRAGDLEVALKGWIDESRVRTPWRIVLAWLQAETGRLEEAAALFEAQAVRDELSAANWNVLATWYLVLGDDARREAALEGRMEAMTEGELSNLLWSARSRVQRRRNGVPGDLEPEDFRAIRWVMRKASRPQNYVWQIRTIYDATKDHRVLGSVAAGLVGHTPEGIYGFLQQAASLVNNIHEEATIDVAVKTVDALRAKAEQAHDRRAFTLLESLLAGRAALVPKTDPAWLERATTALQTLESADFAKGEARLVAEVIAGGAPVKHRALAGARFSLLRELLDGETVDSPDRLPIHHAFARVLWAHGERDAALRAWSTALEEVRDVSGRFLPPEARNVFNHYVNRLAEVRMFEVAEIALRAALDDAEFENVRLDLRARLFQLYAQALEHKGRLSIGEGEALYLEAVRRIDAHLEQGPVTQARNRVGAIVAVHRGAQKGRAIRDAGARLETWARERLPRVFDRYVLEATSLVRGAAAGIKDLRSAKHALLYLLDRLETEPSFLERIAYGLWSTAHWDLARLRKDAGRIDAADENRLLPHVLASLESRLLGGRRTGHAFWDPDYDRYWREKSDDFAAVALRVVELHPENETAQRMSASYLREIGRRREAVGVLLAAYARKNLDASGERYLARWLVEDKRFDEALPIVQALLERYEDLEARLLLAKTLHGLGRGQDALKVLEEAEAWLRLKEAWTHGNVVKLGQRALEQESFPAANRWLEEAVRLRTESRSGRRSNDSTLGRYFGLLARARVALGRTDEAVDAASAGVLAWGHNRKRRAEALDALKKVLAGAKDLDAWVETYEGRVAESGLDAPVIRKTLAAVFVERGQHARAVHHLLAAREIAPEDAQIHERLVQAYDALGQAQEAIGALLASLRMAPRNLQAAASLADRYRDAGLESQARRARSNLVEPLPHEAEGHQRFAQHLHAIGDLEGAARQYRQVIRTDPLNPWGYIWVGQLEVQLGNHAAAREVLEHVLAKDWEKHHGDVKKEASTLLSRLKD